jgi:hypothetical protein
VTASLHPETLHVGDTATGTVHAHHGRVVAVDHFGPCNTYCCLTFADHTEITITADTEWAVRGPW